MQGETGWGERRRRREEERRQQRFGRGKEEKKRKAFWLSCVPTGSGGSVEKSFSVELGGGSGGGGVMVY